MALSKATSHAHNTEVEQLIQPDEIEEIEMGINPAAMKLIIDRLTDLYPKPVESSVREVVSNAIDATSKLPEELREPVHIYTPSALNASFRVVDKGVGMSAHDVREIYSQYGVSTKADDMTQLGAYGLGAKAPLAYCSEFQVTTTKDGITTIFTCARKAMGNVTSIVSSKYTGNPNGTEVVIPAKSRDLDEFRQSVKRFTSFAPDVELVVDGKPVVTEDKYQLFDTFVLDEESNTTGRVWINNERARDYFNALLDKRSYYRNEVSARYVLSGWIYSMADHYYDPAFIVELKPGVVDFSSSRDSITRNDRSLALHKRVTDYYSALNEEILAKALSYVRELPAASAWKFVLDMGLTMVDKKELRLDNRGKTFKLKPEDFDLTAGKNPVKAMLAATKNTCFGVLDLNSDPHAYNFITGSRKDGSIGVSTKSAGGRVGDITAAMQKQVKENIKNPLIFAALAARVKRGYGYYHEARNERPLVIVTDVDEAFTETVRKNRPLLSKEIFSNYNMALVTKVSAAELELCKEISGAEVTVHTPDEVMELIVAARQERRKNAAPRDTDTPVNGVVLDGSDFKDVLEFTEKRSEHTSMKISSIVAEGDFIVLGGGEPLHTLVGAVNDGANPLGKKVYFFSDVRDFRAGHYEMLLGYRDVYTTPEFKEKARTKAARTIADLQTKHARLFHAEIEALTPAQVMRCVANSVTFTDDMWVEFASAASGTEYAEAFDAFLNVDRNFGKYYLYAPSLHDLLLSTFGEEVAEKIELINDAIGSVEMHSDFEGGVYGALFDRYRYGHERFNTPRSKELFAVVAPFFVEHVTELADKIRKEREEAAKLAENA